MRPRALHRLTRSPFAAATALLIGISATTLACGRDETPAFAPGPDESVEEPAAAPATPAPPAPSPAPEAGGEATTDAIATEGVIPEGYPSDVPVYPGANPGPAMTMPGLGLFATFESEDPVDTIIEHFRGELTKGGWAVQDSAGGVDATKEGRSVQVRARLNESGRSEIAVNISESG